MPKTVRSFVNKHVMSKHTFKADFRGGNRCELCGYTRGKTSLHGPKPYRSKYGFPTPRHGGFTR